MTSSTATTTSSPSTMVPLSTSSSSTTTSSAMTSTSTVATSTTMSTTSSTSSSTSTTTTSSSASIITISSTTSSTTSSTITSSTTSSTTTTSTTSSKTTSITSSTTTPAATSSSVPSPSTTASTASSPTSQSSTTPSPPSPAQPSSSLQSTSLPSTTSSGAYSVTISTSAVASAEPSTQSAFMSTLYAATSSSKTSTTSASTSTTTTSTTSSPTSSTLSTSTRVDDTTSPRVTVDKQSTSITSTSKSTTTVSTTAALAETTLKMPESTHPASSGTTTKETTSNLVSTSATRGTTSTDLMETTIFDTSSKLETESSHAATLTLDNGKTSSQLTVSSRSPRNSISKLKSEEKLESTVKQRTETPASRPPTNIAKNIIASSTIAETTAIESTVTEIQTLKATSIRDTSNTNQDGQLLSTGSTTKSEVPDYHSSTGENPVKTTTYSTNGVTKTKEQRSERTTPTSDTVSSSGAHPGKTPGAPDTSETTTTKTQLQTTKHVTDNKAKRTSDMTQARTQTVAPITHSALTLEFGTTSDDSETTKNIDGEEGKTTVQSSVETESTHTASTEEVHVRTINPSEYSKAVDNSVSSSKSTQLPSEDALLPTKVSPSQTVENSVSSSSDSKKTQIMDKFPTVTSTHRSKHQQKTRPPRVNKNPKKTKPPRSEGKMKTTRIQDWSSPPAFAITRTTSLPSLETNDASINSSETSKHSTVMTSSLTLDEESFSKTPTEYYPISSFSTDSNQTSRQMMGTIPPEKSENIESDENSQSLTSSTSSRMSSSETTPMTSFGSKSASTQEISQTTKAQRNNDGFDDDDLNDSVDLTSHSKMAQEEMTMVTGSVNTSDPDINSGNQSRTAITGEDLHRTQLPSASLSVSFMDENTTNIATSSNQTTAPSSVTVTSWLTNLAVNELRRLAGLPEHEKLPAEILAAIADNPRAFTDWLDDNDVHPTKNEVARVMAAGDLYDFPPGLLKGIREWFDRTMLRGAVNELSDFANETVPEDVIEQIEKGDNQPYLDWLDEQDLKPPPGALLRLKKKYRDVELTDEFMKAVDMWYEKFSYVFTTSTAHSSTNTPKKTLAPGETTTPEYPLKGAEKVVTSILQSLGCAALIGVLAATIALYSFIFPYSYSIGQRFLFELALLIAHILILLLRDRTDVHVPCRLVTMALQSLFLSVFSFMAIEAFQAYTIGAAVIPSGGLMNRKQLTVLGWALPAVFTGTTGLILGHHYVSAWSCWLNLGHNVALATVVPVLALAGATVVICEAAGMDADRLVDSDPAQLAASIANQKGLLFVLPANVGSWLFGLYAVYEANVALYSTVFALNVTLAVCIFAFHTLGSPKVLAWFKKVMPC